MTPTKTRRKTAAYFRASWTKGEEEVMTLQDALEVGLEKLPNAANTQIDFRSGKAEIRHRLVAPNQIYLHVASWVHGESASIVPHEDNTPNADLLDRPPDSGWDYLEGDAMILISDNHCIIVSSGIDSKSLGHFIRKFLEFARQQGANLPEKVENFLLIAIANRVIIEQILNENIKLIRLRIGQFSETVNTDRELRSSTNLERFFRVISDILSVEQKTLREISKLSGITAQVVLSFNNRKLSLDSSIINDFSRDLMLEEENEFEIETVKGNKIKSGTLVLKRTLDVKAHGQTIDYRDAWEKMNQYYRQLENLGVMES